MTSQNKNKKSIFKECFPTVLSIALIITGILYIIAVCHLFFTGGDTPYSRGRVGEYLLWLLIPSLITIIMVIVGGFVAIGKDKSDPYPLDAVDSYKTSHSLKKFSCCFDYKTAASDTIEKINNSRKKKRASLMISSVLTAIALIPSAAVVINTERYTIENLNADIASAALIVLGAAALSLAAWCVYATIAYSAEKEELTLIKSAIKETPALYIKQKNEKAEKFFKADAILVGIQIGIVAIAAVLIILGVSNGGMADVLDKAVKICTECIGLG